MAAAGDLAGAAGSAADWSRAVHEVLLASRLLVDPSVTITCHPQGTYFPCSGSPNDDGIELLVPLNVSVINPTRFSVILGDNFALNTDFGVPEPASDLWHARETTAVEADRQNAVEQKRYLAACAKHHGYMGDTTTGPECLVDYPPTTKGAPVAISYRGYWDQHRANADRDRCQAFLAEPRTWKIQPRYHPETGVCSEGLASDPTQRPDTVSATTESRAAQDPSGTTRTSADPGPAAPAPTRSTSADAVPVDPASDTGSPSEPGLTASSG